MAAKKESIEKLVKSMEKRLALKQRQAKEAERFRSASKKVGEEIRAEKELSGQ